MLVWRSMGCMWSGIPLLLHPCGALVAGAQNIAGWAPPGLANIVNTWAASSLRDQGTGDVFDGVTLCHIDNKAEKRLNEKRAQ